jgi:hypothetical protein
MRRSENPHLVHLLFSLNKTNRSQFLSVAWIFQHASLLTVVTLQFGGHPSINKSESTIRLTDLEVKLERKLHMARTADNSVTYAAEGTARKSGCGKSE